ncbi:MAG TPA: NTP transferase domain-containing protein [Blastocatellia bacterium]|nr:NTP transferase domain-containing protein [Blastocatellia bacterium]
MRRLMIIPAAGIGSRLGSPIPKVLYPVNGRPMIDYLLDLYAHLVERFILVLNPASQAEARRYCAASRLRIEYEIQESQTGMLDAILIPGARVREHRPESVWITWCDQIAIRPETVRRLADLSDRDREAAVILPTMLRDEPYIHFVKDDQGEIVRILHRREGDPMPERGEGDIGLFCLTPDAYFNLLPRFSDQVEKGAATRERNFLPFLPWLRGRAKVRRFPAHHEIESIGVNAPDDLSRVESYLRNED